MLTPAALEYAACCARVFPGWIRLLEKNSMSPTTRIEPVWERMPKNFSQVCGTLDWSGIYSAVAMEIFNRVTKPKEGEKDDPQERG